MNKVRIEADWVWAHDDFYIVSAGIKDGRGNDLLIVCDEAHVTFTEHPNGTRIPHMLVQVVRERSQTVKVRFPPRYGGEAMTGWISRERLPQKQALQVA